LKKFAQNYHCCLGRGGRIGLYRREDIDRLLMFRKKITPISELASIYGISYQVMYEWIHRYNFRYIVPSDHPYSEKIFVYSEDIETIATKRERKLGNDKVKEYDIKNGSIFIAEKEYINIREASKIAGFKITKERRKHLKSYRIIGTIGYISREEAEHLQPTIPSKELIINGEKYISTSLAEEMLGLKLTRIRREKLKTYTIIKNKSNVPYAYMQLNEINRLLKLREETISIADFVKSMPGFCDGRIRKNIDSLNIKVIKSLDNFFSLDLIYKNDIKKITDYIKNRLDLDEAKSDAKGIDIYRIHIRDIYVKPEIAKTIALFDDYVVKRFSRGLEKKEAQRILSELKEAKEVIPEFSQIPTR
jgi:transposase